VIAESTLRSQRINVEGGRCPSCHSGAQGRREGPIGVSALRPDFHGEGGGERQQFKQSPRFGFIRGDVSAGVSVEEVPKFQPQCRNTPRWRRGRREGEKDGLEKAVGSRKGCGESPTLVGKRVGADPMEMVRVVEVRKGLEVG